MKRFLLTTTASVFGIMSIPALADVLYDNGPVNGVNGYSNATSGVFGFRRTLLDDFVVPEGGWTLQEMHWNSLPTPLTTDPCCAEISFRTDLDGSPGMTIAVANLTGFSEAATGNIYFSREEWTHWAYFDDIALDAGHYWFEATIVDGENNFWLTADQNFNECWVNYEDLGGLQSGTEQFGVASDINFVLAGVPAPGVLTMLAVAGLSRRRRRRRCR